MLCPRESFNHHHCFGFFLGGTSKALVLQLWWAAGPLDGLLKEAAKLCLQNLRLSMSGQESACQTSLQLILMAQRFQNTHLKTYCWTVIKGLIGTAYSMPDTLPGTLNTAHCYPNITLSPHLMSYIGSVTQSKPRYKWNQFYHWLANWYKWELSSYSIYQRYNKMN